MAMDHIRHPNALAKFDGRAAKLRESLGVIRIILPCHAIQLFPIEVFRVIDEVIIDSMQSSTFDDRREPHEVAHRNRQARDGHGSPARGAVPGEQHGHFVAKGHQRSGQRLDHIRKASGLGERQPFRCDK